MKPKNKIQPLMFIAPALLVYIATVIIPIIWSMGYSFFSWNGIRDMKFVGLENYTRMFTDKTFLGAVVNNFKFVLMGSAFQLILGLFLAILLTHISKGNNVLRVIYFIPCIISSMAICQIFSKMLSAQPQGLVCYLMERMGMEPIALLANSKTALVTITLIDGYKYCGLYMIIFYSAFVSISKDVLEASIMDGCNILQQYRYIKLPLIKNIFSIVIVMLVNGCLKTFDVFYILDNKSKSTEMVATYMYKTAFNSVDFGYGSTLAVFLVIECLVAVGIIQKILGSAKGDESQ
ncbi:MAG: sugar ABC transporter permease [Blautia sp.]|nr:sugar ABC transporter permease [Blautia sp.]MDY3998165.1 sugar ABC transporter permease [Blautia sp.]